MPVDARPVRPGAALALSLLLALALLLPIVGCGPAGTIRLRDHGAAAQRLELAQTAFYPSEDRASAAAALATLLYTSGLDTIGPDQIAPLFGRATAVEQLKAEMVPLAWRHQRMPFVLAPTLDAVIAELNGGQPVLLLQFLGRWRYVVAIGYDPASNRMILRAGSEGRAYQPADTFDAAWAAAGRWAMVVVSGNAVPASASMTAWTAAIEAATASNFMALAERAAYGGIQRWPETVEPWVALGNARYAMKQWPLAEAAYVEALKLQPVNPVVRNNLALVLLERHCVAQAESQLEQALATETDAELLAAYAITQARIASDPGPAIYCPSPEDGAGPTEYELAPLNPDTSPARRGRR